MTSSRTYLPPRGASTAGCADEASLRESEGWLRLALEAGQLGAWEWDLATNAVAWSSAMHAIHGLAPGSFGGTFADAQKTFHPDDRERVLHLIDRILAGDEAPQVEYRIVRPDGTVRWVEGRGELFRDEAGRPVRMAGVCLDVTERRQAELALMESDRRYRRLLSSVTDYLYAVRVEGGRSISTRHGPGCESVTGYSPEAFDADPWLWFHMVAAEDRPAVLRQAARLLTGEPAPPLEHRILRKDGAVRWVRNTPVLHRDAHGKVVGYDGLISDVTERKEAEDARQKSHALLEAIIEGTTDAVFVKDREGRYLMINSSGARFLGRSAEEVLGKEDAQLFSPQTAHTIREGDQRVLASGEAQTYEDVGAAAGITRTYLSTKFPFRGPQGEMVGLIGISRDITERRRAEQRRVAEHAVARALAEAGPGDQVPRVVRAVCSSLGWAGGALWVIDQAAHRLRCADFWRLAGVNLREFEAASRGSSFPPGVGLPGHVWSSGKPVWIADLGRDSNFPRLEAAVREGLRSAFAFPILLGGGVLGVLEFFSRWNREPDNDLVETMASIGSQVGQFMERREAERALHAREQELRVARDIQQGLLPRELPALPGFDVAAASQPAQETSGDYYDFFSLLDGGTAVAVGDAAGHGIGPALLMAEARAYLRALALREADVGELLALTNRRLAQDTVSDFFITLFLARLDPLGRSLVYSSAGHPAGYVLDSEGAAKVVLESTGCPLGVHPAAAFPLADPVALAPGDLVLLLTDGILEARSPEGVILGGQRTLDVVRANRGRSAAAIVEALLQAVQEHSGRRAARDDLTAIVIKVAT
jgi:PAS domain S-box-containing protein